jgi:tetratricopeptide (TPR) repeat protein
MLSKKVVLAVLLAVALTNCTRSPASYVSKGNKYFAQGKYDDALLEYRNATKKDPQYAEAYYRMALVALRQTHFQTAYGLLKRTLDLNPGYRPAAVEFGDLGWFIYRQQSHPPTEIYNDLSQLSRTLLASNPKDFDGLRFKAYIAIADKRADDALGLLATANSIHPLLPDVVMPMAQLSIDKGEPAEGERLLRQLIEKEPSYGPAYETLHGLYMREKRVPEAEAVLRLRVQKNPKNTVATIQLADHYALQHDTAGMNATLQRLRDGRSSMTGARIALADFYVVHKNFDEASRELQQAIQEDPKNEVAYRKRMVTVLNAQGKRDQAEADLDEILKRDPNDAEARRLKAGFDLRTRQQQRVSDAVNIYKDLSAKRPNDSDLRFYYARALLASGDARAARAELSAAIQRNPTSTTPKVALAGLLLNQGQYTDALQLTTAVLDQGPGNLTARLLRAVAETGLGQNATARADLNQALREHPGNEDAELQLGLLDIAEKRYADATSIFTKHYHAGQTDLRPLEGLIRSDVIQGQFDRALALLDEEVKKSPKSLELRFMLASAAIRAGKLDVAQTQYEALAAQGQDSSAVELQWGELLQAKADRQGAIEKYRKARALDPKNAVPAALLGRQLELTGHASEAIASYRDALKTDPNNAFALNNLAFALAESGQDLDDALRMALSAQKLAKDDSIVADTLGWVYLKKGLTGSALQVFQNNVKREPKNPSFRYHLAAALLASGDKLKAKEELQKALQSGPSSDEPNIRQLLAKIG